MSFIFCRFQKPSQQETRTKEQEALECSYSISQSTEHLLECLDLEDRRKINMKM